MNSEKKNIQSIGMHAAFILFKEKVMRGILKGASPGMDDTFYAGWKAHQDFISKEDKIENPNSDPAILMIAQRLHEWRFEIQGLGYIQFPIDICMKVAESVIMRINKHTIEKGKSNG